VTKKTGRASLDPTAEHGCLHMRISRAGATAQARQVVPAGREGCIDKPWF
jgi:hypothetical protein